MEFVRAGLVAHVQRPTGSPVPCIRRGGLHAVLLKRLNLREHHHALTLMVAVVLKAVDHKIVVRQVPAIHA